MRPRLAFNYRCRETIQTETDYLVNRKADETFGLTMTQTFISITTIEPPQQEDMEARSKAVREKA